VIGHLGTRVSALLDGQLSPEESDRAWAHVHLCHQCRDVVEREGWVKTRLATLGGAPAPSSHLVGSLLGAPLHPAQPPPEDPRRRPGRVVLGGSAAVAVLGVVALGMVVGPDANAPDRRTPVTNLSGSDAPRPLPLRSPGIEGR